MLPVGPSADVSSDDISSIISFAGHIGVMWSNQITNMTYFAAHQDGASDQIWLSTAAYTKSSDDHINLKSLEIDGQSRVFAAIKTSYSPERIVLLSCESGNCSAADDWSSTIVYDNNEVHPTRPILLIDQDNRDLYVFSSIRYELGLTKEAIYYKQTDIDTIQFSSDPGVPFIKSVGDQKINDPTSTKQNLNAASGLMVMASDRGTLYYLHNDHYIGDPVADIAVEPPFFDFGNVVLDNSSAKSFSVSNEGDLDLVVNSTELVGEDAGEFAIESGGGAFTLVPGASETIEVSFNPASEGIKNAELRIQSDDPD